MDAAALTPIEADCSGFRAAHPVTFGRFSGVDVYLGDEEQEEMPTADELAGFAAALDAALTAPEQVWDDVARHAFDRYQRVYARFYEQPFVPVDAPEGSPLRPPLGLTTAAAHATHLTELLRIVLLPEPGAVRLVFGYDLDREHGLEVKLVDGRVEAIGAIAET